MTLHTLFDILAWVAGLSLALGLRRRWFRGLDAGRVDLRRHPFYAVAALGGAVLGAYWLGSLNMLVAGTPAVARSVLGGLVGAVAGVEVYKRHAGLRGSTGGAWVASLAAAIAVGRLGCAFSGLEDATYGIPTALPWGWDHGDGIARHPVALYESLCMAAFLAAFLAWARRAPAAALTGGFPWFCLTYGGQRFLWEFLKPYAPVLGPLNVFHLACAGLVGYAAVVMILRRRAARVPLPG